MIRILFVHYENSECFFDCSKFWFDLMFIPNLSILHSKTQDWWYFESVSQVCCADDALIVQVHEAHRKGCGRWAKNRCPHHMLLGCSSTLDWKPSCFVSLCFNLVLFPQRPWLSVWRTFQPHPQIVSMLNDQHKTYFPETLMELQSYLEITEIRHSRQGRHLQIVA